MAASFLEEILTYEKSRDRNQWYKTLRPYIKQQQEILQIPHSVALSLIQSIFQLVGEEVDEKTAFSLRDDPWVLGYITTIISNIKKLPPSRVEEIFLQRGWAQRGGWFNTEDKSGDPKTKNSLLSVKSEHKALFVACMPDDSVVVTGTTKPSSLPKFPYWQGINEVSVGRIIKKTTPIEPSVNRFGGDKKKTILRDVFYNFQNFDVFGQPLSNERIAGVLAFVYQNAPLAKENLEEADRVQNVFETIALIYDLYQDNGKNLLYLGDETQIPTLLSKIVGNGYKNSLFDALSLVCVDFDELWNNEEAGISDGFISFSKENEGIQRELYLSMYMYWVDYACHNGLAKMYNQSRIMGSPPPTHTYWGFQRLFQLEFLGAQKKSNLVSFLDRHFLKAKGQKSSPSAISAAYKKKSEAYNSAKMIPFYGFNGNNMHSQKAGNVFDIQGVFFQSMGSVDSERITNIDLDFRAPSFFMVSWKDNYMKRFARRTYNPTSREIPTCISMSVRTASSLILIFANSLIKSIWENNRAIYDETMKEIRDQFSWEQVVEISGLFGATVVRTDARRSSGTYWKLFDKRMKRIWEDVNRMGIRRSEAPDLQIEDISSTEEETVEPFDADDFLSDFGEVSVGSDEGDLQEQIEQEELVKVIMDELDEVSAIRAEMATEINEDTGEVYTSEEIDEFLRDMGLL